MKFDLHVHTKISYDSKMTTDELVETAKAKGLSGVAIADHNAFAKHRSRENFYIIPACEFSTDVGHLVVYFLKESINEALSRDECGRFYWRDICKAAHEQGALVFYAHPFAPPRPHTEALYEQLDGIEVFNSRVVYSRLNSGNKRALELCRNLKKPFSIGSDAHCPAEVGAAYWECDLPEDAINAPDFEEKLKAELLSYRGKLYAGAASPFAVLKAKRYMYRSEKLYHRLIKSYFTLIGTFIRYPFANKYEPKILEVYNEDELRTLGK